MALLYGLAQVSTDGGFGHAGVIIPLGAGVVLLAAYCVHALRTSATPMVDLRLFRSRAFTGASTLLFLAGLSIYGRCCCCRCTSSRSGTTARWWPAC